MVFTVYVLQSQSSGKIYIGQTTNLERRILQHNDLHYTRTKHTKRNSGPWQLVHSEICSSRSEAMKRERALKTGQGRAWIHQQIISIKKASGG